MKASADGTFSCELNNATHRRYDDEFVDRLGYLYLGTEVSSSCFFFFFALFSQNYHLMQFITMYKVVRLEPSFEIPVNRDHLK